MIDKHTSTNMILKSKVNQLHVRYIGDGVSNDMFLGMCISFESPFGNICDFGKFDQFHRDNFLPVCEFIEGEGYIPTEELGRDGTIFSTNNTYTCANAKFEYKGIFDITLEAEDGYHTLVGGWASKFRPVKITAKSTIFPHSCPKCGGPAYVGFSSVDCQNKCS